METEKEALAFLYASGNSRRPSGPSGPLIMSKGNNVNEVLAEFDGSIQNKGQLLLSFLLGSKSTVHDVYKISANSFLFCLDSEWVGE